MERSLSSVLVLMALGLQASLAGADPTTTPDGVQRPLVHARLALVDPGKPRKRTLRFSGSWSTSDATMFNPATTTTALRVRGEGPDDGDSGPIELAPAKWHAAGHSYTYSDPSGAAGGVERVRLVFKKGHGGRIKIVAGRTHWGYALGRPQGNISVAFSVGSARWCAAFGGEYEKNDSTRVVATADQAPTSCPCPDDTTGTWQAIQQHIFARQGCADDACHGAALSGGLDLRPEHAYASLVEQPSEADPTVLRVKPGLRSGSMLWLKLAKSTLGGEYDNVPKAGMPLLKPALTKDELEVVRLWIMAGAPETGVIGGTANLLESCLPPPDPIKFRPAPVPAATDGVQFHAPPWTIKPRNSKGQNGEGEVCYATWYDVSAIVPDAAKGPCDTFWGGPSRECFFWNRTELTQDPNSHHSIIAIYKGQYRDDPAAPEASFGPWTCLGGASDGQTCDPKGPATQCPGGGCAGSVVTSTACFGYGPADLQDIDPVTGPNNPNIGGSQAPYLDRPVPPGVFGSYPTSGIIVWNSHAFNVSDRPTTNEQYLNVFYAEPDQREYEARSIFLLDVIFVQNVPPYERREYCATHTVPVGGRIFDLSSHTHKRGVLFRIWEPPSTPCLPGPDCTASAGDPIAVTTTYNDATTYRYPTPKVLDDPVRENRTYRYCSVYDNGATDPTNVKRRSTSRTAPVGGKCGLSAVQCIADGPNDPRKGILCGKSGKPDDRLCDSAPGAQDGQCDACPLRGGVTTEDEMFILLGTGYCEHGTPCEAGDALGGPLAP